MKLWKRAAGALKDRTSLWLASLSAAPRGRYPPIETFIIKATSHDEDSTNFKSTQRVLATIRTSPSDLDSLHLALSSRVATTRSWPVALKSLILMHRVLSSTAHCPAALPFDLSAFRSAKHPSYESFIRAYFDFLYHRSSLSHKPIAKHDSLGHELMKLVRLQGLLDRLLKVKPREQGMRVLLILEAMDLITKDMFEIYRRICNGIADVLVRINTAKKEEAAVALQVIRKAMEQEDDLTLYLEYCHRIGVLSVLEYPYIEKIPDDEDIREIKRIINGKPVRQEYEEEDKGKALRTIITDKWEVFEDASVVPPYPPGYEMPDLITF